MDTVSNITAFRDIVGQDALKQHLSAMLSASREKGWILPHLLFCGPRGIGKTTIAHAMGKELGDFQSCSAKDWTSPLDFTGTVSNAREGSGFIVEDFASIPQSIVDYVLHVLKNFTLRIRIGSHVHAISLPRFTMLGTCSELSRVNSTLLKWFTIQNFEPYTSGALMKIAVLQSRHFGLSLDADAARLLVSVSNGLPGDIKHNLQRIANLRLGGNIRENEMQSALRMLGLSSGSKVQSGLLQELRSMSGIEFEEWVASLFRRLGYAVTGTKRSGDHGIDLIVQRGTSKTAVQCKRYSDSIGEPVLRDFVGALINIGFTHGIFITTSRFSNQATIFAAQHRITLLDIDKLLQLAVYGAVGFEFPI
jgi:Holliday junction resolvasome RuvABC ATP-dependent DNA helicase subunit